MKETERPAAQLARKELSTIEEDGFDSELLGKIIEGIENFSNPGTPKDQRDDLGERILARADELGKALEDPETCARTLSTLAGATSQYLALSEGMYKQPIIGRVREMIFTLFEKELGKIYGLFMVESRAVGREDSTIRKAASALARNIISRGNEDQKKVARQFFLRELITVKDIREVSNYTIDTIMGIVTDKDFSDSSTAYQWLRKSLYDDQNGSFGDERVFDHVSR